MSNEQIVYRIWLRDAATVLSMWNRNPSSPYYLHGSDISSAQFQPIPAQANAEIQLSLQNCLEPFPAEHHGRYDFVHVRLLVGALRKGEYELAIKNVFDILSMNKDHQTSSYWQLTARRTRWLFPMGRNRHELHQKRYIPPTTKPHRSAWPSAWLLKQVRPLHKARRAHQERSGTYRLW